MALSIAAPTIWIPNRFIAMPSPRVEARQRDWRAFLHDHVSYSGAICLPEVNAGRVWRPRWNLGDLARWFAGRMPCAHVMGGRVLGSTITTFTDTFTANAGTLSGRATETGGGTWIVGSGTWLVASGACSKTFNNNTNEAAYVDISTANQDTYVTFASVPGGTYAGGICWRVTDDNNYNVVDWTSNAGGRLEYYKKVSGSFSSLNANTATGGAPQVGDILRVTVSAANVTTVYINGVQQAQFTDAANSTGTKCGQQAYTNNNIVFTYWQAQAF